MITTVAIESPFKANERFTQEEHVMYARMCMLDSLQRGEAPFLSHLLYTQVWNDAIPDLRAKGIAAGLAISERLGRAAFYADLGWSEGMIDARDSGRYAKWERRFIFTPIQRAFIESREITIHDFYKDRVHV